MTARRTSAAVAALMASVPAWIELTMVVREEQRPATTTAPDFGNGEDDGPTNDGDIDTATETVEIVTKAKMQRGQIRYFYGRRDHQAGSEVHFTNGHIMIVQEPIEAVKNLLPGFVPVHIPGAPSEVMVNPTNVRFLHGHVASIGSSEATPGTRLTFPNGNKLEVTESYDELAPLFDVN